MPETTELLDRLDAEFRGVEEKIKQYQAAKVKEFEGRQQRLEQFSALCEKLNAVWKPRLDALAQKFKDRVQVTPTIGKASRSATFRFQSPLARFYLTFTALTDEDVRHLVLDCTLDILPILMNYEKNCQLELPLGDVDPAVVGKWMDDRIVDAVRNYLALHQNANYLKGHLVRDPIANVEFPKYAAAATLEHKGQTYYFIGEETRDEFAKKNKV
jgi:YHS domain-containing protein